ncbi:MAG: substrate-binding domain-containing protein [Bacteroidota bacterium]
MERLFDTQQFDAVLGVNEVFAVTAMKIAQKRGLSIPENMSFIGFTDGILSRYTTPTLTTVAQHGFKMGEIAARMLIAKLEETENDESVKTEVIKTSLIERESTRR